MMELFRLWATVRRDWV